MALFRRRPPQTPLSLGQRLVCLVILLLPFAVLSVRCLNALIRQIDGVLAQAAPIVSAEATRSLQREVHVGELHSDLTAGGVVGILRRFRSFGTVPVVATDIAIANGRTLAGSGELAHAPQVTLELNIPALLSGKFTEGGLARVELTSPYLLLVRESDGTFNVTKILPPKPANQPPSPPFRTYVAISDGHLTFRDYKALFATPNAPAVNDAEGVNGFADLTGARDFRFAASARAQKGTPTASRLTGGIHVNGFLGRGLPGTRTDAPSAGSARFAIEMGVTGAYGPYWLPYFVALPDFRVTAGYADVNLGLSGARPPEPGVPDPHLSVDLGARVMGASLVSPKFPAPLTDANGTATFNDGVLHFEADGKVIGAPVSSTGTVWNLGNLMPGGPPPTPMLAVRLSAPRIPVAEAMRTFLPKGVQIPAGVQVDGVASANGAINGPVAQFVVTGVVSLPTGRIAYEDLPSLSGITANVTYAQGLLGLTNIAARIEDGGSLQGRLGVRVLASTPQEEATKGNAIFSARVQDVSLARLASLRRLTPMRSTLKTLRLAGRGTLEVIGKRVGGVPSLAANITTNGLVVGKLPFPVASARVVLDHGQFTVPAARIVSPAGAVTVNGGMDPHGTLSLLYHVNAVDVGKIAQEVGLEGVTGLISASGSVSGTTASPRVLIERAVALNLHLRIPARTASNGAAATPARRFAVDTLTVRNAVLTRTDLVFQEPLLLRRYPAVAAVSGRLSGLDALTGKAPHSPHIQMTAKVSNLDFAEVLRQAGIVQPLYRSRGSRTGPGSGPLIIPTTANPANANESDTASSTTPPTNPNGAVDLVRGSITTGTVVVNGSLTAPQITGAAELGRLLVGPYPIDGGYVRFAYGPNGASIPDARLRASIGVVTASAALTPSGRISGSFRGGDLDLAPLSFLTNGALSLGGKMTIAGNVSGDVKNPTVTAHIEPSDVNIAGIPLTGLHADKILLQYAAATGAMTVNAPSFAFAQNGTQVSIDGIRYDFKTGRFGAGLKLDTPNIGALLDTVRRSDFADTPAGSSVVQSLDHLPYPIGGEIAIDQLDLSGRVADGTITERSLTLAMHATGLQVGGFTAKSLEVAGSLRGDLIHLTQLQLVNQSTTIRGSGTVDISPQGQMNVVLETNQASLDLIPALTGASFPVRGLVDVFVAANGPTRNPLVTASLEGRDLVIAPPPPTPTPAVNGQPVVAQQANVPAPTAAAAVTSQPGATFTISLLRAEGALRRDANGDTHVSVPDLLIRSGDNEVRGEADIPIRIGDPNGMIAPDRPLSLRATLSRLDLATLIPSLGDAAGMKGFKAQGNLTGTVGLSGTLSDPALDGHILLAGGQLNFPKAPGSGRDLINPISSIDTDIRLSGDQINISKFRIALGAPNGQKGNFGDITAEGAIRLQNLRDLQRLVVTTPRGGRQAAAAPINIDGNTDLRVAFNNLRPVLENATALVEKGNGLGELIRGGVNGQLRITGPILTPTMETAAGQPIRLTDAYVQLPTRAAPVTTPRTGVPSFNPSFAIDLDMPKTASVVQARSFRLDAVGGIHIGGSLYQPEVQGTMTPTGGYYNYAIQRFLVKKGGDITIRYTANEGLGVTVSGITATARVYAPTGTAPTLAARASDPTAVFGSTEPPTYSNANSYKITIDIKGPLLLSDQAGGTLGQQGPKLTFSSDPFLTEPEIIALIGTEEQIALATRGDLSGAVQLGAEQALYSSVVPRALAPLESSLANAFGLEEFGLEYNPDAPFVVRFVKRLPEPLDRFTVEVTRSFETRPSYTYQNLQPYTYRLNYEIYQLHPTGGVRPRLGVGVESDEQRITTFFIRGTINY